MKWVEAMKGLAFLSIAIFFSVATWSGYQLYSLGVEKFPEYETRWYKTFHDIDSVSESINRVADVAAPVSEAFPKLVAEVNQMNVSVAEMNGSVAKMQSSVNRMDKSVSFMAETVPPQMGYMADQLGQIQHRMTPGGMMRNMMP